MCFRILFRQMFSLSVVALTISFVVNPVKAADNGDITFNPSMLKMAGKDAQNFSAADLSYFSEKGGLTPGEYQVDVYFNSSFIGSRKINFIADKTKSNKVNACLTPAALDDFGVKVKAITALNTLPTDKCLSSLKAYIPESTENFDVSKLRLDLTVPQAMMKMQAHGEVDPAYWDEGINALMLNYAYSGSKNWSDADSTSTNDFLNLRSGANLGAWRLRNYSTWSHSTTNGDDNSNNDSNSNSDINSSQTHWDSINTYAQRDLKILQGTQLTLGQYNTPSDVFDSVEFSGVQMASDDAMLPDSMTQFAPTVRGIAKSNAQVTIKQGGNVIYQTYIPPGPFTLNDLYPSGNGGDLIVQIKESDGSITQFTQGYNSLPVLQREGRFKYGFTAGQYRSGNSDTETPNFGQLTLIYGLPYGLTIYGGAQYAENYTSGAFGLGKDMQDWGALSVDATSAKSQFDNELGTKTGQSYRIMYAKDFEDTDTNFQVASYRYSTDGYYSFGDVQDYSSDSGSDMEVYDRTHNKKSKSQININQQIGDFGTLTFSGSQQNYWQESGTESTWQTSFSTSIASITYNFSYSYNKSPDDDSADQIFAFNVSIPLDKFMSAGHAWASYSMNTDQHNNMTNQVGLSGTALPENNLNYAVQQGYQNKGSGTDSTNQGSSGNATLDYKGTYGEMNAGYNYDPNSHQVNYGAQGSVLVHANGVTFSQQMNDTVALVKAPGASDVGILNNTGVHTDWRGYTVVPFEQPYRYNRVALSTDSYGDDVDIENPVRNVVPTRGAVVLADFDARVGKRGLITLTKNGQPIPFGATASLDNSESIVGDAGQVYLTGMEDEGVIHVKWGNGADEKCDAHYTIADNQKKARIAQLSALCR